MGVKKPYDFAGWVTKNNLKCSDNRTIRANAFADQDGEQIPLVYQHDHKDIENVLGHMILENRKEGVYGYGYINDDTPKGKHAKSAVKRGDITKMSIWANDLVQKQGNVLHGVIREVSLVLSGANPGAIILEHSTDTDDYADWEGGEICFIAHSMDFGNEGEGTDIELPEENGDDMKEQELEHSADNKADDPTIEEVYNTLNDQQKLAVDAIIAHVMAGTDEDDDEAEHSGIEEGDTTMRKNPFDNGSAADENVLSHSDLEQLQHDAIMDGKRFGSLKESFKNHAEEYLQHDQTYGIKNIEYLFPDAKNVTEKPDWIKRQTEWVAKVMAGVHHTPFSRIKSIHADITADEARAKGYVKGNLKTEEVFELLRRTTDPQTIYKKQKLDRDDIIDITDFDVVAWIKVEMRMMLEEEIARAILVGDGRSAASPDKIQENHVRSIYNDAALYTVPVRIDIEDDPDEVALANKRAKAFIRAARKSRKLYKGSGSPTLFTTEDFLSDMLLLEDGMGRLLYETEAQLATALRVKEIVVVEVMEGLNREVTVSGSTKTYDLAGIIVNLIDYNVGADKGGQTSLFEDFDIDYNQEKYLIETRMSGALIKPFSALVLEVTITE